jgi:LexA-binding, inner membrane-associated putative hydrolase
MFIGHLPASYILTTMLLRHRTLNRRKIAPSMLIAVGLFAGIAPDLDLFYFFLIDNQQTLHHDYWVHIPFFWFCIFAVFTGIAYISRKETVVIYASIAFANLLLHLFLDTIVGKIQWAWPVSDHAFYFFEVPALYTPWFLNFVLHWTFSLEIIVLLIALWLKFNRRSKRTGY